MKFVDAIFFKFFSVYVSIQLEKYAFYRLFGKYKRNINIKIRCTFMTDRYW